METINLIRLICGCTFISFGLLIFIMEMFCINRLKYILNRMHFAGAGDTAGLAFTLLGTIIINGCNFASLKLALVIIFFWFGSPVSSHLISRLVAQTDEEMEKHVKVLNEEESKKLISGTEGK